MIEIDLKTVIALVLLVAIMVGAIILRSGGGGGEASPDNSETSGGEDPGEIGSVLDRAESALRDKPDRERDMPSQNPYARRTDAPEITDPYVPPERETSADNGRDSLTRSEKEATDIQADTSESFSAGEDEGNSGKTREQEIQERVDREKEKLRSFYGGIASWANSSMTATVARNRAYDIHQKAEEVRENAEGEPSRVRSAMLERAREMDNFADRLALTRGNAYRIRTLIYDARQRASE